MLQTVAALMQQCRNYFEDGYLDGTFRITGNVLEGAPDVRYVCISGSRYHDGVWELADGSLTGRDVAGLKDEEFTGRVWELSPPLGFLDLCQAIETYEAKNPVSAVIRETFGGYSREWAEKLMGRSGASVFFDRVREYQRMFTEVG